MTAKYLQLLGKDRSWASWVHTFAVTGMIRNLFSNGATEERENGFEDFGLHQLSLLGDHTPLFLPEWLQLLGAHLLQNYRDGCFSVFVNL